MENVPKSYSNIHDQIINKNTVKSNIKIPRLSHWNDLVILSQQKQTLG